MNGDGWRLDSLDGVTVARCVPFGRTPGVAHAFSTRSDGEGVQLHDDLKAVAGIAGQALILEQVHGCRVVVIDETTADGVPADGAIALAGAADRRVPTVRTADCVPILLADDRGQAVAAVHAGWRGTAAAIVVRAIELLAEKGVRPASLQAALGPAIGGCCYEVGSEVTEAIQAVEGVGRIATPSGDRFRIDLHRANRAQLQAAGLDPARIHAAPWCTCCRKDLFYSYRRDGASTGRLTACIGWS